MTQEEIINQLKEEFGVELTGQETYNELRSKLSELKKAKAQKEADEKAAKEAEEAAAEEEARKASRGVIVWLKSKAYFNDTHRYPAGVYRMTRVPERLARLPQSVCEVFEGDIHPVTLTAMAKWCGITHPEVYTGDELLEKITSEAVPLKF